MINARPYLVHLVSVIVLISTLFSFTGCSLQGEQVSKWANEIGHELYNLGEVVTEFKVIKETYKSNNAQVEENRPTDLLAEITNNIGIMMDWKMDAIKEIQQRAENISEELEYNGSNYKYYSSKYSPEEGVKLKLPKSLKKNAAMYKTMHLNADTHFYNLSVNTSHSSVHVPTNVYDREPEAAFAIQWSEALDEIFEKNYKTDPALSWQYFGSTSGIMRHFPGKKWDDTRKDLFDCRIRTWFIEAATCTKDVIILMDNSGSMDGMGKHIGALTAYSILDTFSNNDYVNVMNYSETTDYIVPCFNGSLVQATRENIHVFKEAIQTLDPDGKTRLEQALQKAFVLLQNYRRNRGCDDVNNTDCNQAIMIITDSISGNLSETIMKYNYLNNGTNIPVRIFTYLIGKEVTNEAELQWIACANRGFHTHVQSLEQVTASVLQYINVIARPLVLQGEEHPISWTHAYIDITYDDTKDTTINEPFRLLTAAAIPCFDRKTNNKNDTRTANLLGVAATDVPIDDFRKLTLPYKIGVNGYAFIVSNNGYVLMHPDLRPVFQGILKENYNSVDLTEVEQLDDGKNAWEISDVKRELRDALVNGLTGSMENITIKYHYDDMRRVSKEVYDYYFTPLNNTPFSIGLAFPRTYGHYSLKVEDVIKKYKHTGIKLIDFFKGNWKIHPKWTYCKYHYLEGHEYDKPEDELVNFLGKMYDGEFVWKRQYEPEKEELDNDSYYCDRKLVERLIFDASATEKFVKNWTTIEHTRPKEWSLITKYNVTLTFLATMSGLTRWDYIDEKVENNTKKEFGDIHARAIDETWYKSAVLQHKYNKDAFVFSVPFNAAECKDDCPVTSSYAIFPSDAGKEAPGSVVGYQFSLAKLKERAMDVAFKLSNQCSMCGRCNTTLDCYIVDNNGYIVLSLKDSSNDTGKFFGDVEDDVLISMIEENIFEEVILYDLQALCTDEEGEGSSATRLMTPLAFILEVLNAFVVRLFVYWKMFDWSGLSYVLAQDMKYGSDVEISLEDSLNSTNFNETYLIDDSMNSTNFNETDLNYEIVDDDDDDDDEEDEEDDNNGKEYFTCRTEIHLYVLNQDRTINIDFEPSTKNRPYYVKSIQYSNLIFVAINNTVPKVETDRKKPTIVPQMLKYDTILACEKKYLNNLARRRLTGCFNEHPLEHEIQECGRSAKTSLNVLLLLISLLMFCIR